VLRGCIDALPPTIRPSRRWSAREWFDAAAGRFVRTSLPRDGSLVAYGEGFAEFLGRPRAGNRTGLPGRCRPARSRLDRSPSRRRCAGAGGGVARRLVAEELLDTVLVPHPARAG
jgi:hypothetical protein